MIHKQTGMASTCWRMLFCQVRRIAARTSNILLHVIPKTRRHLVVPVKSILPALLLPPVAFCETKSQKSEEDKLLQPPDPSTLTTEYLIRNTSLVVIDAATSLLTQTTTALLDVEKDYVKALDVLVTLMEFKLTVLDDEAELQQVLDYILQIRQKLDKLQQKKKYLDSLYLTSTNLLSYAAEAAFTSGSENKGILANELLRLSEQEVEKARIKTQLEEKRFQDIEVKTIHLETKHEEDKKKGTGQQMSSDNIETVTQSDLMKELGQTQKVEDQMEKAPKSQITPEDIFNSGRDWEDVQDEEMIQEDSAGQMNHGEDVWDTEKEFTDSQKRNEDDGSDDEKPKKSWKWW